MDDSDDDEPPMLVTLVLDEQLLQNAPTVGNSGDSVEATTIPRQPPPPESKPKEDLSDLPPCPVTILSGFLGTCILLKYIV